MHFLFEVFSIVAALAIYDVIVWAAPRLWSSQKMWLPKDPLCAIIDSCQRLSDADLKQAEDYIRALRENRRT